MGVLIWALDCTSKRNKNTCSNVYFVTPSFKVRRPVLFRGSCCSSVSPRGDHGVAKLDPLRISVFRRLSPPPVEKFRDTQ